MSYFFKFCYFLVAFFCSFWYSVPELGKVLSSLYIAATIIFSIGVFAILVLHIEDISEKNAIESIRKDKSTTMLSFFKRYFVITVYFIVQKIVPEISINDNATANTNIYVTFSLFYSIMYFISLLWHVKSIKDNIHNQILKEYDED